MRRVEHPVNGFALGDVDCGCLFVINVLTERRFPTPDACFDVEGSHLKRKLGTEKLNNPATRLEIKLLAIYSSRKVGVKVAENRIEVDFYEGVPYRLLRNVLDFDPDLVAGGKHRRFAPL